MKGLPESAMINDVFYTRYRHPIFHGGKVHHTVETLFIQVAHIIFEDLTVFDLPEEIFTKTHRRLAREIGLGSIGPGSRDGDVCGRLLCERYDLWNDRHGNADYFIKLRLSLVELLFREMEEYAKPLNPPVTSKLSFFSRTSKYNSLLPEALAKAIIEFNDRCSIASIPLHYHNGYIQFRDDNLTTQQIDEPFWTILRESKWANVDTDIKEAIDRRDNQKRDAVLYAFKALESTIKIISDEKGFTSGREKGASNFIDNLVSQGNGRFIDVWEAELMRLLFTKLRNPHGHGPGSQEMPQLLKEQETMVIENVMSWVKSLIRRL
jgi:hypothetical protein